MARGCASRCEAREMIVRELWMLATLALAPAWAAAESVQTLDDAWWTGPLLAANASTLPHGHFLVEPYLFDSITHEGFDSRGVRHEVPHQESLGSLTYVLYGVTDRISAGVIPRFGYTLSSQSGASTAVESGDWTLQGQYRLTRFEPGSWIPTTSVVVGEILPTGRYDRLGAHPADGFGGGVHTTIVSIYSQDYFWMPNGRILRSRLNFSYAFSDTASLRDVSVYGTTAGFRGQASPGDTYTADASWEYSVTRNWVLALDAVYEHDDGTRVRGTQLPALPGGVASTLSLSSGASRSLSFAPAIEYNWSPTVGFIMGVKVTPDGRNASAPVIPVMALNLVY
jgi:hypothetical protein